jgi:hypothetical protein
MSLKKTLVLLGLLFLVGSRGYAQSDSVHVYLLATGLQANALQVHYQGQLLMQVPAGQVDLLTATIPVDPAWKLFTRLAFGMTTTRSWGSWRKDVSIPIPYHPPLRYLIIRRNAEQKRNAPLNYYWSDRAPIMAI